MPQAILSIVAQNLLRLFQQPGFRRWALALALPFAGIVAAFGIAPDTATEQVKRTKVIEEIALAPQVVAIGDESYWREERVQRGDTVASLFARLQVEDAESMNFLRNAREARPLFNQLVPGRTVRIQTDIDGKLLALRYLNGSSLLSVKREGDTLNIEERVAELESRIHTAGGEIRSSLFAATDALNIPDAIAMQLVEVFSTDIDFHKDLRKEDRFSLVYEMFYDRGEAVRAGRLLSAEFVNQGKTYHAIWFAVPGGKEENAGTYYTLDGRNIRKAFLRSPLEFSRITSGFTTARYHPVLQTWRAHNGVDYAAPIGTKIKATADGVVDFAGVQSGYGNVIVLRHQSKFTTLYAHMSGFASGVRKGTKVQQGDIIGFVGMTGMTTGPHVHYEFRIDGVHHNPLSVAMPVAFPIAPEHKQAFSAVATPMSATLALLRGAKPAQFE